MKTAIWESNRREKQQNQMKKRITHYQNYPIFEENLMKKLNIASIKT